MTEEEAKKEIIDMANALQLISNTPKGKAVLMAIKALEQDNVLDKIRAEIELKEKTLTDKYGQQKYGIWTDEVLQIIDKYKAESE